MAADYTAQTQLLKYMFVFNVERFLVFISTAHNNNNYFTGKQYLNYNL